MLAKLLLLAEAVGHIACQKDCPNGYGERRD
jgi:hypothetical protein